MSFEEFIYLFYKNKNGCEDIQDFALTEEYDLFFFVYCSMLLKSIDDIKNIDTLLDEFAKQIEGEGIEYEGMNEYCVYPTCDQDVIAECFKYACFPMALKICDSTLLLIRDHSIKCIITFDNLHIPSNIERFIKNKFFNYKLTFNKAFSQCIKGIQNAYPECWIYPELAAAYQGIHDSSKYQVSINSVEIWDGDTLVAGEIGFITGSVYVSLSGFHIVSDIGNVQMAVLGLYLQNNGFSFWDLGMSIPYKYRYGAVDYDKTMQKQIYATKSNELYKFTDDEILLSQFLPLIDKQ